MTPLWVAIVAAALGCFVLKFVGVALPASVLGHPRVQRAAVLLPIGMLSALVLVELFDAGGRLGWDWRQLAGVAAGGVALLLRQGVLVVFVVAVATTALLRLVA